MRAINDRDFVKLVGFVRERYGINLERKRALIDARLSLEIKKRGYDNFTAYINAVLADPEGEECRNMINRLSTNYTFFFRESDYIEQLNAIVLPHFIKNKKKHIRIWCAACSSGQEAYSLAMALAYLRRTAPIFDFEIIGTDINTEMLQTAQRGIYSNDELAKIPLRYRQYTSVCGAGHFIIAEELRHKTKWKYHNLLEAEDKIECFDIIFCRNVMIYFTPQLRREMTVSLYHSLSPQGFLFTGATESIDLERKYFRYLAPAFYQATSRTAGGES